MSTRRYTDPTYVSPSTLRRRRGRAIRKSRRATRARLDGITTGIRAAAAAVAGLGAALSGVTQAMHLAYARMRMLEEAAAQAAIDTITDQMTGSSDAVQGP